ncbi:WD40/YVTN/BNR-like repeat-containing protein [Micromonospora sp. IBSANI012]|uniref:WD40/YVTN/BNR-like repeat-containing protein n=1 Tax=Micromonospora sp. IBSANI012 TaxID=3457761 RepID=UPI0040585727
MSDREFTGFDVDTVVDAVRQPPLDDLWATARARRRRRSGGIAIALVVVFAGMAALPLAAGGRGIDWADPTPPPRARDRGTQLFMTGPDSAVGVEHGSCTIRFTHTDDGGRSWTDYDAARYRATTCRTNAYGDEDADVEFSVLGQRSYLVRDGDRFRLSTDYGRTWRDEEQVVVTVSAFPAKARPVYCQEGCGALRQPVAVDPSTGTVYRLSGEQPSPYPPFSIYPSTDGTIWVTYPPGEIDRPMVVARSADRGATWNTWRPAAGADVIAVAGVSAREAYLLIEPPPPPGAQPMEVVGPSQLLHTTDGGATWTDVGTDLPAVPWHRPLVIGADGSLLVAHSGNSTPELTSSLLVSRDGGRHFTTAREYDRRDGAVGAGPGYAWLYGRDDMSALGADHVLLTADGGTWTRFPLPM